MPFFMFCLIKFFWHKFIPQTKQSHYLSYLLQKHDTNSIFGSVYSTSRQTIARYDSLPQYQMLFDLFFYYLYQTTIHFYSNLNAYAPYLHLYLVDNISHNWMDQILFVILHIQYSSIKYWFIINIVLNVGTIMTS